MEKELNNFLRKYGSMLVDQIKKELSRPRLHAPGYNRTAYNEGRNSRFKIQAPTSPMGSTLYESIAYEVEDGTLSIEMADHWENVVSGMKPQPQYLKGKGSGTSKLIPALVKWAQSRGISDAYGVSFAIRRNIFKFGIEPFNFLETALDNLSYVIEEELPDEVDDIIDELLDNLIMPPKQN